MGCVLFLSVLRPGAEEVKAAFATESESMFSLFKAFSFSDLSCHVRLEVIRPIVKSVSGLSCMKSSLKPRPSCSGILVVTDLSTWPREGQSPQ